MKFYSKCFRVEPRLERANKAYDRLTFRLLDLLDRDVSCFRGVRDPRAERDNP